jgi:alanine-glyoxylate transaminase / serine-glyoxylate transaminase / serine-pyruvate transaminase
MIFGGMAMAVRDAAPCYAPSVAGRSFLQIPGPTNVPDRLLDAMRLGTINPRGPEFPPLLAGLQAGLRPLFGTSAGEILLGAGSGSSALEGALVNVLAPGDEVLAVSNGFFGAWLADLAGRLGLRVDHLEVPIGTAVPPELIEARLREDVERRVRAVTVVHNETSTGVRNDLAAIRRALDAAGHPALLVADTVSSLGCMEVRFDEWGLDVAATGSQKGLMLPPGVAISCVSERALAIGERGGSPRGYYDWKEQQAHRHGGLLPVTPPTPLLFGLREALRMLEEEGLERVFARHDRLAEAVRRAVGAWGLSLLCRDRAAASPSVTAFEVPPGLSSAAVVEGARQVNVEIITGIEPLHEQLLRIGHMGWLNETEVLGALGGIEVGLQRAGFPVRPASGLQAAQEWFFESSADRVPSR